MWKIKAEFRHNDDPNRLNFTFYDEEFKTQEEAVGWLEDNYETLSHACLLDCENERDLEGFYLDEIVAYEEATK